MQLSYNWSTRDSRPKKHGKHAGKKTSTKVIRLRVEMLVKRLTKGLSDRAPFAALRQKFSFGNLTMTSFLSLFWDTTLYIKYLVVLNGFG